MQRLSHLFALLATLLCAALAAPAPLAQQPSATQDPGLRPVTRTFAITNARVVQAPGRVLDRATVVVRDGLITAVAPDARVPSDAEIIVGDTLVVYAAFIDALGTAGVSVPVIDTSDRVANPDDPPRDRAGILPDRLAQRHLDPGDSDLVQLRNIGFGAAHVAPGGGLLSGQSAVILLSGDRAEELVLVPDAALVARFDAGSGVYPGTPMGVAATLRERFRQAAQVRDARERYAADPTGRRRPLHDPVAEAILPALEGRQPVYFVVDDVLTGQRALRLADEIGFNLVLAGVPESSIMIDQLRRRDVAVLAPLALPDAVERDTTLVGDPGADLAAHIGGEIFITERRTRSYVDVEAETEQLSGRRGIAAGLYERNPLTLHEAGVPFAFASLGESASDFRSNLRRMIAVGLSPDIALMALTTSPAELLGLERSLGTVDVGKMANLLVTDGDYFHEDSRIRLVVVDGRRFEIDSQRAAAADPDAEVVAVGTWEFRLVMPDEAVEGRLDITGSPDDLAGTIRIPNLGTLALEEVRVEGNRLTFVVPQTPFGAVSASGVIVGDTYEAELQLPGMPPASLTATRRPDRSR